MKCKILMLLVLVSVCVGNTTAQRQIRCGEIQEIEENGVSLGEMNAKLLQKIEVLTLHIIDLQNQIDELKQGKE